MSKVVNRIMTEQLGGRHSEVFVAKPGEIFYDFESGALRIGDGVTPGGHSITESSPLESLYIGDWVYFKRPANRPDIVDKIADNLWITRNPSNNHGGIYNSAPNPEEDGDPYQTGGSSSPAGTDWNTDGWDDFSNATDRYYENFTSAWSGGGWAVVKHNWIMHDTFNDKYYAIRFLTWVGGGNTGEFSYIRREINTAIYFNRADTNTQAEALDSGDEIAQDLVITRDDTNDGLLNFGLETDTRLTTFNSGEGGSFGATWYEDGTFSIEWSAPSDIDTALKQLKVGDEIIIENGDGYTTTTLATAFDIGSGTLTTVDAPASQVNPSYIEINLTKLFSIETEYENDESPIGTLWNAEGYDDLTNLVNRQFTTYYDLFANQEHHKKIVGKELVMWDTVRNEYYAIKFTRWSRADYDYRGFAYIRRKIDVNKLTAGLKFNDGAIQQTAYSDKIAGTLKQTPVISTTDATRYISSNDIGKVIYLKENSTTTTIEIPDGGTVDFPVGATITIINRTGGNITIQKDNEDEDGTIYGAGTADDASSWTIPDTGGGNICILMKIETGMDNFYNDWMLSGSGIVVN